MLGLPISVALIFSRVSAPFSLADSFPTRKKGATKFVQEDLHGPVNDNVNTVQWTIICIRLQDRDWNKTNLPIPLQFIIFKPSLVPVVPQDTNFHTTGTNLAQMTVGIGALEFERGSRGYVPNLIISNCVGR